MSQFFQIHPENPQPHLIREAAAVIRRGGIIIYPTDSAYALGCQMGDKQAIDRIRQIRQLDAKHNLTLVCRNLSELSTYAQFDDYIYRLLKAHTPGPYTFILKATSEVPRRLQHPKRKTIGLRVPNHPVTLALLEVLDEPIISTTLQLPGAEAPIIEPEAMRDLLGRRVDLVIDCGTCGLEPTTVVDLVDGKPRIVRAGKGDIAPFLERGNFVSLITNQTRVVSGMRATGKLHLGHYHGVLKNWIKLQHQYECLFFVADWHALTTHYETPGVIANSVWDMVIDWLAAGIDPNAVRIFIQSHVPEHAELHVLLSMITPLSWLERIPSYKDQQQQLKEKDLSTYGFLGYPVLMSADVLIYKAGLVPVGEDQLAHLEVTREIARRFNHLYGREANFAELITAAIKKLGKKNAKLYQELLKRYQEQGDAHALATGQSLLEAQGNLAIGDRERLMGHLEGSGRIILPEPHPLLTPAGKLPGLDGRKMSKSYNNTINLREAPEVIEQKIRTMPTDPARVRRNDPGEPEKCPVWYLHKVYSDDQTQEWVQKGCRSAGIGCLECKQPLIDKVKQEQAEMNERAQEYEKNPELVRNIIAQGCDAARDMACETLTEVRQVMGLDYL